MTTYLTTFYKESGDLSTFDKESGIRLTEIENHKGKTREICLFLGRKVGFGPLGLHDHKQK